MSSGRRHRLAGLVAALAAVALCGCSSDDGAHRNVQGRAVSTEQTTGSVRVRLALARPALTEVASVIVKPDWGGVNRGPHRDQGWLRIPASGERVVLVADAGAESSPVLVAEGSLPAGPYTRVAVAVPQAEAVTAGGVRVGVASHVEPIALPVTVPAGGELVVDIILTLLAASSDGDGRPELFVRGARAAQTPAATATEPARGGHAR